MSFPANYAIGNRDGRATPRILRALFVQALYTEIAEDVARNS